MDYVVHRGQGSGHHAGLWTFRLWLHYQVLQIQGDITQVRSMAGGVAVYPGQAPPTSLGLQQVQERKTKRPRKTDRGRVTGEKPREDNSRGTEPASCHHRRQQKYSQRWSFQSQAKPENLADLMLWARADNRWA